MATIYIYNATTVSGKLLRSYFSRSNHEAHFFEEESPLWEALGTQTPDLLILDLVSPKDRVFAILSHIRAGDQTRGIPMLLLSEKEDEQSIARGLELGADDFILKPISTIELEPRIHALLRRSAGHTAGVDKPVFEVGTLKVDTGRHIITVNGAEITLSLKEYSVLVMLLRAEGLVCSRELLLSEVWGENYGESRTLDVHIRRIRRKLQDAGKYIQTVKGIGYKLNIEAKSGSQT